MDGGVRLTHVRGKEVGGGWDAGWDGDGSADGVQAPGDSDWIRRSQSQVVGGWVGGWPLRSLCILLSCRGQVDSPPTPPTRQPPTQEGSSDLHLMASSGARLTAFQFFWEALGGAAIAPDPNNNHQIMIIRIIIISLDNYMNNQ